LIGVGGSHSGSPIQSIFALLHNYVCLNHGDHSATALAYWEIVSFGHFFQRKKLCIHFDKNGLGHFFLNSSGQPGLNFSDRVNEIWAR
jgi:hypothetical protein